jgi:protease I
MSKIVKRILFVLMPHDFNDTEFLEPYNALQAAGHEVEIAGFGEMPHVGMFGYSIIPHLQLLEMTTQHFDKYDALVIPGGKGSPEYLWNNEELQDVVRYFHDNEKLVAAICYACIVLVQADILMGEQATVYPTDETKEILEEHGVDFVDEECVVLPEVRVITAQGPKNALIFAQAIVNMLD